MEGDEVPSLRVAETFEEIVGICLFNRQRYRGPELHRQTEFLRDVWHRPAAFTLAHFEIQVADQAIDALLKCFTARHLNPINGSWRYCGIDEVI